MKKLILLAICLVFAIETDAQILNFGVKAGLNYNENGDLKSIGDSFTRSSNEEIGYHLGVFSEINIPIFYIRPELMYTKTNSSYLVNDKKNELTLKKIDIPVLLGFKFLKFGRVFAGPAFQYILDTDISNNDYKNVAYDDFTVGLQFGAGVQFGKLGADIRWERSISNSEAAFVEDNLITNGFKVDTRAKQFIFSVSYSFL